MIEDLGKISEMYRSWRIALVELEYMNQTDF